MTKNNKIITIIAVLVVLCIIAVKFNNGLAEISKPEYRNEVVGVKSTIEIHLNKEVNSELKSYLTDEQKKSLIQENGKEYLREDSKFQIIDENQFDGNSKIVKMRMSQEDLINKENKTESLIDVVNKRLIENGIEQEVNANAFNDIDVNNIYTSRITDVINDTLKYVKHSGDTITYNDDNRTIRNLILASEQLNDIVNSKDIVKSSISYTIKNNRITKVSIDIKTIEATISINKDITYTKAGNIVIEGKDKSSSLKEAVKSNK